MLPDLFAPAAPGQLTFEQERDDLLRRYEADGRYQPSGQYAPTAFAGLRECFLPKMLSLLQRHAAEYPALLDGLELALSRIKEVKASGRVAYEFDGLLLVERLERQVSRLKLTVLPAGDVSSGKRVLFAALGKPVASGPPVPQQRHHYEQATRLLGELARALTRDALAFSGQVAQAGVRLWAFMPLSTVQLPTRATTFQRVLEGHGQPWSGPEKRAVEQWWHSSFEPATAASSAEIRQAHEAAYLRYRPSTANSQLLTDDACQHWAAGARQVAPELAMPLFSTDFFRQFCLSSVLVATCQPTAARVRLAVAGLFGLTDPTAPVYRQEKQLRRETMRCLQALILADSSAAALLFEEMLAWHVQRPISLDYQNTLSSYLTRQSDLLYQFYDCLPEEEPEDLETPASLAEKQAALSNLVVQFAQMPAGAVTLIGSYLRPTLRALFDSPGFLANVPALGQFYGLLVADLTTDEREVIETILLDQALLTAADPASLLRQPDTALSHYLRLRLCNQLLDADLAVDSPAYLSRREILHQVVPLDEKHQITDLALKRYDIRYFLFAPH